MKIDEASIRRLLDSLGLGDWREVERIDRINADVRFLAKGSERRVLRVAPDDRHPATAVAKEYAAWGALGIPVPAVYASGRVGGLGVGYVLLEYINATPFDFGLPLDVQVRTMQDMGRLLATMRGATAEGFGLLDAQGRGRQASWSDFVHAYNDGQWLVGRQLVSAAEAAQLQEFVAAVDAMPSVTPVLLHGDFKPKNMFVDATTGAITGVIDPNPKAGDPLWDLAVCLHFIYREQARRHLPFTAPDFDTLRTAVVQSYQRELGRDFTDEEQQCVLGYGCMVDTNNAKRMIDAPRPYDQSGEAEYMVRYVRKKLALL